MFGRTLNTLSDHSTTESQLLTHDQLVERWEKIHNIVYPAITSRVSKFVAKAQEQFAKRHKILQDPFPPGAAVMTIDPTRSTKLDPVYEGPFRVLRRNRGGTYLLQDHDNTLLSRPVPPEDLKLISQSALHDTTSYIVDRILQHRGPPNKREYLVKWKHFDDRYNLWIPHSNFDDIQCISDYWKQQKQNKKI